MYSFNKSLEINVKILSTKYIKLKFTQISYMHYNMKIIYYYK